MLDFFKGNEDKGDFFLSLKKYWKKLEEQRKLSQKKKWWKKVKKLRKKF